MSSAGRGTIDICVIGAGPSGLCVVKSVLSSHHVSSSPNSYQVTVYERSDGVGGVWRYSEEHQLPVHTSMYRDLTSNLPKEVMAFPGDPFPSHLPSYVSRCDVLQYLEAYSKKYNVEKYVKFNSEVVYVLPVRLAKVSGGGWLVAVRDVSTNLLTYTTYDYVIIASGHNFIPHMPQEILVNLSGYTGKVMHSHDFKHVQQLQAFTTFLCVGGGTSAQDIALQLCRVASKVIISSHKGKDSVSDSSQLPSNLALVGLPEKVSSPRSSISFCTGEVLAVDVVILCTGYSYSFPFLSAGDGGCELEVTDNRITPLYRHMVHIEHPTLMLVGVASLTCPFLFIHVQVQYMLAVISGRVTLPSRRLMREWERAELEWRLARGMRRRHAHRMGELQWQYLAELCAESGDEGVPEVVINIYNDVYRRRRESIQAYKRVDYTITDQANFTTSLRTDK